MNVIADALSRQSHLAAISTLTTQLEENLEEKYLEDAFFKNIWETLQNPESATEKELARMRNFELKNNKIYLKRDQ